MAEAKLAEIGQHTESDTADVNWLAGSSVTRASNSPRVKC